MGARLCILHESHRSMNIKSIIKRLAMADPMVRPNICYGQNGEDLILDRLLEHQARGFYVDIGAHHPVRFSNTYLFYRRGWRGINIDAMPGSMKAFNRMRPLDINIESGVAGFPGELIYHCFNESALNTFDSKEARLKNKPPYALVEKIKVTVDRLDSLLERHLPANQKIDFLSVDVEGMDEEVLRSNDWQRFRPRFILAETLRVEMSNFVDCPVVKLLGDNGYAPVSKAYNTIIFADCI